MRILLSAALLAAGSIACADTVWLKNGGKLEGVTTTIEGDKVIVKRPGGVVKLDRDQVEKIVHRTTPMEEYELLAAKLKADDVKGHLELANWCAENRLPHYERVELEAVIAADPDHAEARKRLSYEKVGGKWLRGEELLLAKGMVKVDGKWVTKEAAAAMAAEKEKKRLEKALAEAERKAKSDAEETEAERLRAYWESRARVDRRIAERDNRFDARRGYGDGWYRDGFWAGTVGYYPYGYIPYGYGYPGGWYGHGHRHYRPTAGVYYRHGDWSFSFGTSHYGHGWYGGGWYGHGWSGAGTNSYGPVGPYGNSSGNFNRGGLAPGYGGYPR